MTATAAARLPKTTLRSRLAKSSESSATDKRREPSIRTWQPSTEGGIFDSRAFRSTRNFRGMDQGELRGTPNLDAGGVQQTGM